MTELQVTGMTCNHCVSAVTSAVHRVDPAACVRVDLAANRIQIESDASPDQLSTAISEAGYDVLSTKEG